jgi:hypothetical protein
MKYFVIALVVFVAAIRPFMPPHPVSLPGSYEAMAHILAGGLIGAWLVNRQRWLLWSVIGFSAVELLSAAASLMRG